MREEGEKAPSVTFREYCKKVQEGSFRFQYLEETLKVFVYRGLGPIESGFRKNRLDKSCSFCYCRVDESGQGIQRQS